MQRMASEPSVLIRKKFLKWQDAHPEFPRIVFHGLRHSSATYQLMISGGDLTLVGALREGEIVGLTPEDFDFDAADGIGTFRADS